MKQKTNNLFDSKVEPIPRLRPDIDVIPVRDNGHSYLYFRDMRGYLEPHFALDRKVGTVLSLLDGRKSINDLKPYLGKGVDGNQLLEFVRMLDENRLLLSSHFKAFAQQKEQEYEQADVHQSVTAGNSYPADPHELKTLLDDAFMQHSLSYRGISTESIHALYAPHIDPRVGMETYVQSFQMLKDIQPTRVVILATSHYSGLYGDFYQGQPFVVSSKNFEMPLATIPADHEAIARLLDEAGDTGLSGNDRAHRIEHSIELHLLFLSYLWQHDFSIVPVVIGGFGELLHSNGDRLQKQIGNFSRLLRNQFGGDDDTFFLISGDLAHVGKKFGDERPAATMREEVRQFDEQFLTAGEKGSTEMMMDLMKEERDPYRICGYPPLYTFLHAFPELEGQRISYDRWDQTERESAVTFGSILYQ